MKQYPVAGPWITDLEVEWVAQATRDGWYDGAAVWPARFEQAFAAAVGRAHAVSLPSCTSGLHLALAALGIGRGDEVIVPEATWIATSAPISYVGATPVFADIDPDTWCLSARTVEACLTPRTRAVIPVDLYGCMPDWEPLLALASASDVAVLEDAAEAVGSRWLGRPAGAFGVASVFSFHGSKTLTTGEGGMLVTDDEELFARVCVLRDHGRMPGDVAFMNREVAYKYKMSALQAALGCAQLHRLDELVGRKKDLFRWYSERLKGVDGLTLNPTRAGEDSSFWMITMVIDAGDKVALAAALAERGVSTRPFFHPLSDLPAYADEATAGAARARNTAVRAISPHALNLPSALSLQESDVDEVCTIVRSVLGR